MTRFLLDSNCFITAFRFYYPFEIFPALWIKIFNEINNGDFYLIDKVYEEIQEKPDKLAQKFQKINKNKILYPDKEMNCLHNFNNINSYLYNTYTDKQSIENFIRTDAWLIAYVLTHEDAVIVTMEKWKDNPKKPLIPKVCEDFNLSISPALKRHYDFQISLENEKHLKSYRCITLLEVLYLKNLIVQDIAE